MRLKDKIVNILAPMLFFLLVLFLLKEPLLHPEKNLAGIDFKLANVHWRNFMASEIKAGRMPLWNPYINAGQPFLAHPESSLFYPFTLLYLFLPVHYAMTILIAVHLFIAAISMEWLSFYFTKNKFASFFSGIGYMFSGYFISKIYAGHLSSVLTASLLPFILLLFFKTWFEKKTKYLMTASLGLAILIFAGFPENTAYLALYLFLLVMFFALSKVRSRLQINIKDIIYPFRLLIVIGVLAFLLSAIQLFPSLEYVNRTTRGAGLPYEEAIIFSLTPEHLANLLSPTFYNKHIGSTYPLWEYMNYFGRVTIIMVAIAIFTTLSPLTIGLLMGSVAYIYLAVSIEFYKSSIFLPPYTQEILVVAFLILVSIYFIIFRKQSRSERWPLVFAINGLVAFILSFGNNLPFQLYRIFWQTIPIFKLFRIPSHFLLLTTLSCVMLAAYGLKQIRSNILKSLVIGLAIVDFLTFSRGYITTDSQKTYPTDKRLVSSFEDFEKNYRFYHSYGAYTDWTNLMSLFDPNAAISRGIESVKGSDTLILKSYADFASIIDGRTIVPFSSQPIDVVINNYNSPLLNLLSTRYFLMLPNEPNLSTINPTRFRTLLKTDRFQLFENREALAKGTMIYNVARFKTKEEIVDYMRSDNFDWSKEVVVDEKNFNLLKDLQIRSPKNKAKITLLSRVPNKTIFMVETDTPGVLLMTDLFYPGWQAKLNGSVKTPIIRVDYTLRGILIPKGTYDVEVFYNPKSLITGVIISISTLLGLAWYARKKFQF